MTTTFQRGQKSKIDDLTPATRFQIGLRVGSPGNRSIDLSCFGLDGNGRLSDDRYFIFFNQPNSPCGSIRMSDGHGWEKVFEINIDAMPNTIRKLVFAATVDGNGTMSEVTSGEIALLANGNKVMSFPFSGAMFGQEKAIMVAEVYHKTVWRISAVGQGFNGGLQALIEHFGGSVAEPPSAPPPRPAPAAEPKRVNLGKVTLEKRGQSQRVSLAKRSGENIIHINLNWDKPKRGWWGGGGDVDLDLGCMFALKSGARGVIQPLGNCFGQRHDEPFIVLDKDDRSGAAADGENMRIYKPEEIKRIVIFAMIYEGTANFTEVNGRVTINDGTGTEILVRCDAPDARKTFCAVCSLEPVGSEIKITKEELYFPGHSQCDRHFGFGFRWVAGSK